MDGFCTFVQGFVEAYFSLSESIIQFCNRVQFLVLYWEACTIPSSAIHCSLAQVIWSAKLSNYLRYVFAYHNLKNAPIAYAIFSTSVTSDNYRAPYKPSLRAQQALAASFMQMI